jgi:hypothetical protein
MEQSYNVKKLTKVKTSEKFVEALKRGDICHSERSEESLINAFDDAKVRI